MNVDNHAQKMPRPSLPKKALWLAQAVAETGRYWHRLANAPTDNNIVRKNQLAMLQKLANHAWNNIPFYRSLWENAGFRPDMLATLDDFRRIPVIDKATVMANAPQMLDQRVDPCRLSRITTGGTTGMPMEFLIDNYHARAKEQAHQLYTAWRVWGYRQGVDRCITLRGARIPAEKIDKGIFWTTSNRDRGLTMSSFHLLDENYPAYIARILAYRPQFIRAYPSSIVALCLLMQKHNQKGIPGLRGVLCSSENVFAWQRQLVRDVLGVEIFSWYGHTEKAVAAYQKDNLMLFPPLYGYAEFVDENLDPVTTPGQTAQVIATGFNLDAFPFIRYNTADMVQVGPEVPGFPQTALQIMGRNQDFVIDKHGNKVPFTCSDEAMWGLSGIDAYQYVQNTPGILEIHLLTNNSFDTRQIKDVQRAAAEMFVNFTINVTSVPDIPRTKAGKFRYLIQNIK